MDVREKLVELIVWIEDQMTRAYPYTTDQFRIETTVDHLIANGVTVKEWIPVTERLPEKKGSFLVYVKTHNKWGGYIKTAWFTPCYEGVEDHMQGKKIWYDYDSEYGDYEVHDVTHWMPLQEPPKGE